VRESEWFALGLGLVSPWKVVDIEFIEGTVYVHIDFERGAKFEDLPVHDTVERSWRHLNFFKYPCVVKCRVPRVKDTDGSVRTVEVPWARPGSGFTMDFELHALSLMRQMPVLSAARELKVSDTRLWRVLRFHVERSFQAQDIGTPKRIGVDETAARRGHDYISVFVDLDAKRVLFACRGRSGVALALFKTFLDSKGVSTIGLDFTCDMSPAYLQGIKEAFPDARVTLDKFHLVAMLTKAVDETRKAEGKRLRELAGSRWIWLKNPQSLTASQQEELRSFFLQESVCETAKAYGFKLGFQELFSYKQRAARRLFQGWLDAALASGLNHVERVARTLSKMKELVLNWFETRISYGILEGFHSVLQATKNKARGYKDPNNLIAMSYLLHGKLDALTHSK
jgi:transposase